MRLCIKGCCKYQCIKQVLDCVIINFINIMICCCYSSVTVKKFSVCGMQFAGGKLLLSDINLKLKSHNERQQGFIWDQRIAILEAQIQAVTQKVPR